MNNIRKNHVSAGIYYHETNKTTKYQKQNFSSSFIGGGSNSHIKPSSKPQGGGGGGSVPPTPPTPTCPEEKTYIVNEVTYELEVEYSATSNDIQIYYTEHTVNRDCSETDLEKIEVVTVTFDENDSTDPKTISGTIQFHGNDIVYSFEQEGEKDTRVVAKFNVNNISSPTPILYNNGSSIDSTTGFSSIEIDGVDLPNVVSAYTFSTIGKHIVKYTLVNSTSICDYAFTSCSDLINVTIPNSVTTIGVFAFGHCYKLKNITIPSGVTNIDFCTFNYCSALTNVIMSTEVTNFDGYSFNGCYNLIKLNSDIDGVLNIPTNTTSIGEFAFQDCRSLTTVIIPSGVTSIGRYAFYRCYRLTNITSMAITPPILSNVNAFSNTNDCPIYVPSISVDTYKTASGWSTYSSRIQAIP